MSSSPEKKRKKIPTTEPISILSLPDELLFICLAHVSRLYYPTLSLVCKHFRSLLASPELYRARSLLGLTESCLYVCVWYFRKPHYRWFTLCRKPENGYVLVTVPIPDSPPAQFTSLVAAGSDIYNIAGSVEEEPICVGSSRVSILDCRTHTWREGPSYPVELYTRSACVVDGNVYVAGTYIGDDIHGDGACLEDTFQMLDTEAQVWVPKPIPEFCDSRSACVEGKFHLKTGFRMMSYDSEQGRWDVAGQRMGDNMVLDCYCAIDNVLYSAYKGGFKWFDTKVGRWRNLKGLVGLPNFLLSPKARNVVKLADHAGKMAVFWLEDLSVPGGSKKMVSCVEIALVRRKTGTMWGIVEWFDQVLPVSKSCHLVKALAATL